MKENKIKVWCQSKNILQAVNTLSNEMHRCNSIKIMWRKWILKLFFSETNFYHLKFNFMFVIFVVKLKSDYLGLQNVALKFTLLINFDCISLLKIF